MRFNEDPRRVLMQIGTYLILSLFCSSAVIGQEKQTASAIQPNILFIMADDHARQAISAYDSTLIRTPNLDRLAHEGMRFTNSFVTNSICSPSRAVLLTGKYSHKNGLRDNRDTFDGNQQTMPKLLQTAGYQTTIIGKWHLKSEPTGFDTWDVLKGQGQYYNPVFLNAEGQRQIEGYTTDIITDLAIETLENRDESKPFLLLVHHKAPHRNWMPNLKYLDKFVDIKFPVPATFYDDYKNRIAAEQADMRIDDMFLYSDFKLQDEDFAVETGSGGKGSAVPRMKIDYRAELNEAQKKIWDAHYDKMRAEFRQAKLTGKDLLEWKYQRYMRDYLRCILSVDENVGRLLDYLDAKGLAENTVVVYTSDQGFYLGEHGWYDKRFMYEESLSMPLLVRYPHEIKAGQVSQDIVLNLDFTETFLDFAGAAIPEDVQGESFRPVLHGITPVNWRTSMYYHYYEYPHGWHMVKRHYGVRTQNYKLIHFYNDINAWELYDLRRDPTEINNLIDDPDYAGVIEALKLELQRLQVKYGDSVD
ncbi:MAG: sulfatase [Deferribacteres bacterium]|nr:sulfatase [candidate division KSB1 bacterium]MCB9501181.1 sulfatase [Deferribacteres bacterium]